MIGAAHSLSAHVVREIQHGGREQGALGHSEGCGLEGGYGDPNGAGAEVEVAGNRQRKKARLESIGQTLWVSVACLKL